jgi:flagellar hook assembly protein FlgD
MNCARFVNAVTFNVYNRWGKEVYSYQSDETNSIYIDWNGKDNAGKDLDVGTYYYVANVVFDVLDPKKQNRTLHGWVVILR